MRTFSIMSLVLLAACNGGTCDNDCDNTTVGNLDGCDEVEQINGECDDPDDTGTEPTAMGSFTAPKVLLPDGALEDCVSNLNEDISVPSGETKSDIPAGEYDLTFGSLSLATEYSDWLGVHTSSDGSRWIAPSDIASIAKDTTLAPEPPAVSRYIGGETWTCNDAGSEDDSTAQTVVVRYQDDVDRLLIGINGTHIVIDGELLSAPDDCNELEGEFITSTQIIYHAACGPGDNFDIECWKGSPEEHSMYAW